MKVDYWVTITQFGAKDEKVAGQDAKLWIERGQQLDSLSVVLHPPFGVVS